MNNIFSIFLCFFLLSCNIEDASPRRGFDETFTMKLNESVEMENAFTLKVTQIEDSRCPRNVNCPWEGVVNISFSLFGNGSVKETQVQYNSVNNKGEVNINGQKFIIKIKEVTPYPENSNNIEKSLYKIVLTVSKN